MIKYYILLSFILINCSSFMRFSGGIFDHTITGNEAKLFEFELKKDFGNLNENILKWIRNDWPIPVFSSYEKKILTNNPQEIKIHVGLKRNTIAVPFLCTIQFLIL